MGLPDVCMCGCVFVKGLLGKVKQTLSLLQCGEVTFKFEVYKVM